MQKTLREILKRLLLKRGINGGEISEFISDKPKRTYDPFLMNNIRTAAERVIDAVKAKEKICIYGDYDADGVTSTAIMFKYLSYLKADVGYYIPSRFSEGYGLNKDALSELKKSGVDLVITVDCGSVSYEEVEHGKEIGLDFVITDHHDISEVIADAIVVSPKYPESIYPFSGLAGCGVVFKLIQAMQRLQSVPKKLINELLEFVAIGTIGDIMPMIDENRTMVKYGLQKLNTNPSIGLKKLMEFTCSNVEEITAEDVSFRIVPYINAAGRMGSADAALSLLLETDEEKAEKLARVLIENNEKRRAIQSENFEECERLLAAGGKDDAVILLECGYLHEGIAGIVAGKLKEKYSKPVILVTESEEGLLKGSSRSFGKLNLHEFLDGFSYMFERFGGHAGACGFTIKKEKFAEFEKGIVQRANKLKAERPDLFEKTEEADLEVSIAEMSTDFLDELKELEPFGKGFERPMFAIKANNLQGARRLGNARNHIRFFGVDNRGRRLACIKFNAHEKEMQDIESTNSAILLGYSEINEWKGARFVQFKVSQVLPIMK